ncbi:MAG: hypothetical protein HYS23_00825 [Geobacter sp.]|nr:hypothetical protein [Geobacter sp.]
MSDYNKFFIPAKSVQNDEQSVTAADAVLEAFTESFNARDTIGMDSLLHFPHVMYLGGELIVWEAPGQLPPDFFAKLIAKGWERTVYESKTPILVSSDKVHFRVIYTRRRGDGSVVSTHDNVWIVTRVDGRWAIALRSY